MKLNIYRASAGSGKTFTLASEFIISAFDNEKSFSRILAVTFTNKAAGEMKERILGALDDLVENGSKSGFYPQIINHYPSFSEQAVVERAKNIRAEILHNYSDFHVNTIDSFVQRIVRAFCYDININSGFRTETDEDSVISELTDRLFQNIDNNKQLHDQLLGIAQRNIDEGKNWDFREEIHNISKLIFSEKFAVLENDKRLKDEDTRKEFFAAALGVVESVYKNFFNQLKDIKIEAENVFKKFPDISGKNLLILKKYLTQGIVDKDLKNIKPKVTIVEMGNGIDSWYNKNVKKQQENYMPQIFSHLNPLLQRALGLIDEYWREFITAKAIRENFYVFSLLCDIAALMPEYRQENRMMLVSDATLFLNRIISGNDAPFIYERVGTKYDRIFIDEFQDTSEFQWLNFKPLVDNTLALGYDDMIVGDVKQAIYRWRGGDWTLLNKKVEQQIGSEYVSLKTLDTNWRSKKNIVDFNNAIFSSVVAMLSDQLSVISDRTKEHADVLKKIYSDFYQKIPSGQEDNKKGGKVSLKFFEKVKNTESESEGDLSENAALQCLAQEIDAMLKSNKYKAKDICVLVRTKKDGAMVVNYLLDYMLNNSEAKKYEVISGESLFIANSEPVKVLSNAMEYISTGNQMSFVLMVRAYANLTGRFFTDDQIFKAAGGDGDFPEGMLPDGFDNITESYGVLPLYDLTEKLIEYFKLSDYPQHFEYLRTFEDCVLDFTKLYSSDLGKFVDWWKTSGSKTAIQPSENQDAIMVMTVHKSKGLAFRVVFVPFCNWKLSDAKNSIMWVNPPKNTKFENFTVLPIRVSEILGESYFDREYAAELLNLYVDALNIMYVAFTRAEEELHIYCDELGNKFENGYEPEKNKLSNVGQLIYGAVNVYKNPQTTNNESFICLKDYFDEDNLSFVLDTDHNPKLKEEKLEEEFFKPSCLPNCDWESKLSVRFHAPEFFIEKSPFRQEKINFGLFMHELMSKIIVKEDSHRVLDEMKYQGRISDEQKEYLSQKLDEVMSIPQVANWFSTDWEVKNETALLSGDGNLRIPDRVLFSPTQTVVIDFKFGEKHQEYHNQLHEYSSLLSEMGYPNISSYLFFVESLEIEQVD